MEPAGLFSILLNYCLVMGKTKQWSELDPAPTPARPGVSGRRRPAAPGRFVDQPVESVPLPVLFRLILQRLRRSWIAFRFQANRYTLGAFRRQAAFKIGLLALVGYLFFGPQDGWSGIITREGHRQFVSQDEETTLDVGATDGGGPGNAHKPKVKTKSETAPVGADELYDQQAREYVERFHKIAQVEMEKYGIPASISLAQGLVESRAGTSKLARQANNHFGMKCFSRQCARGHCMNATDDSHKDFFRIYTSPWESWRAHSIMLSSGRYASLKKYGRDYRQWAYGLKRLGYATNRSYAEKLIGMIQRFDLQRFDQ